MALARTRPGIALLLGTAAIVFLLFVVFQYRGDVRPLESIPAASLGSALAAGFFAFRWPSRSWLAWGLLLSSAFWVYLLIVFAVLAVQGRIDPWPIADAVSIASGGCAGAAIGAAIRATPRAKGPRGRAVS